MTSVAAVSFDALSRFGHALSDPTRARILMTLKDGPSYPAGLADEMAVSRQSISNHLACLRDCGLVVALPEGRRSRYELADSRLGAALTSLADLVLVVDPNCCCSSSGGVCACP
jgi:DNA-binding transcriptional ArsR family regulator